MQRDASEYESCLAFDLEKLTELLDEDLVRLKDDYDKAK